MITQEQDVEIHALKKKGWSITAIANHVGVDRKTVRKYLNTGAEPGVRQASEVDPFDRIEPYVAQRLVDDPHVRATVLFAEVQGLAGGYERAYETFCRQVRQRGLRPHCEACAGVKGRAHVDIEHPPGEEIQWDWLELAETPWGEPGYVLVGALSHSAKFRAVFCESMDQPHLIAAIHDVLERLGGTACRWRVDRMITVINPNTGKIQGSFAPVAKYYGVGVDPCPPRRGNRKGVVEKMIDYLTQSWWRTARVTTPEAAQASLDRWCEQVADQRLRDGQTIAEVAAGEALLALPAAAYPTVTIVERKVAANALVAYRGNRYSVPPGLINTLVNVQHRHGSNEITVTVGDKTITTHTLAPPGSNRTVRHPAHTAALENVVLAEFNTERPCASKLNRPPSQTALAIAAQLNTDLVAEPVIDLDVYRRLVEDGGVS